MTKTNSSPKPLAEGFRGSKLRLAHIYSAHLNIYGDRGNVISLVRRAEAHGLTLEVEDINIGEPEKSFKNYDILFIGGGQDKQQELVATDLLKRRNELSDCLEAGLAMLAICGGYQLLGHYYINSHGEKTPGLAIIDVVTESAPEKSSAIGIKQLDRLIGNVVAELVVELSDENSFKGKLNTLVGFENHSGRTGSLPQHSTKSTISSQITSRNKPLAKIIRGHGNNGEDGYEGANYKNLFCSYLHGSLLPKNPHLADEILIRALKYRYGELPGVFTHVDSEFEMAAHKKALALH